MVSLTSLAVIAAVFAGLALVVARRRGLSPRTALADAVFALLAALTATIAAAALYALAGSPAWGSWALLAGPPAAAVALRGRGRRGLLRALVVSGLALIAVVVWLTLHLRGPRAWTMTGAALAGLAVSVAVGAAACLGAWSKRAMPLLCLLWVAACADVDHGRVELSVIETGSGLTTPARVELTSDDGVDWIPDGALPIFGDCGAAPVHNWLPWAAGYQASRSRRHEIDNPYTATRQFYVDGTLTAELPPGRYRARAFKGLEHRVAGGEVVVETGGDHRLELRLDRWIDLPAEGWYGADDHLHIPRPAPRFDAPIATWMQAEDLHVANLLQMGLSRDVHITPQRSFGPASVHREGDTLVVSGQENPRTHVLGHSIVLGAREWIDFPDRYPLYDRVWRAALEQGAVNGYAHWALGGAEEGLALWGPEDLLDFIEVLNLGLPYYERWYEALNLGLRIGPTAGTDYPCLPSLPGRERFYTRLDGPLDYEDWLEAVRRGRTFVTNGPAIDLSVSGVGIGDELRLDGPSAVHITGSVRFDPERDDVRRLELIRGGEVVHAETAAGSAGRIDLDTSIEVGQSSWFALRAVGVKRAETDVDLRSSLESMLVLERGTNQALLESLPEGQTSRPSTAHTGAIWVEVERSPPLAAQPAARRVIAAWLERLDELQARFGDDRIGAVAGFPGRGDGIDESDLRAHRDALLEAIDRARSVYLRLE